MAHFMKTRHLSFFGPLVVSVLLAGCSTSASDYPSLSIRNEERVTGVFDPVEAEPYVTTPPTEELTGRVDQLRAMALAANTRFQDATKKAHTPVARAQGAEEGTEAWSLAQIAIAELESSRSDAMIALADLDRLFVDAELDAVQSEKVKQARDEIEQIVHTQDEVIAAFFSELNG